MNDITLDEFIIGTVLGDGCIPKLNKGAKNYRWTCGHSWKQQEYLQWKVHFLENFDLHTGSITKVVSNNSRYKEPCVSYHTKSKSSIIFNYYRNLFYRDNVKSVPESIIITPNILTILYMDDGHLLKVSNKTEKAIFNLHSFSNNERDFMCYQLQENFGIIATSRHNNGEVAISAKSMEIFKSVVNPLPLFNYKMGSV